MDKERTMVRSLALAAAGLFVLFTSGCAQIPTRELSQYRDAFDQVQKTSEDILVDFAQARENFYAAIEFSARVWSEFARCARS